MKFKNKILNLKKNLKIWKKENHLVVHLKPLA